MGDHPVLPGGHGGPTAHLTVSNCSWDHRKTGTRQWPALPGDSRFTAPIQEEGSSNRGVLANHACPPAKRWGNPQEDKEGHSVIAAVGSVQETHR